MRAPNLQKRHPAHTDTHKGIQHTHTTQEHNGYHGVVQPGGLAATAHAGQRACVLSHAGLWAEACKWQGSPTESEECPVFYQWAPRHQDTPLSIMMAPYSRKPCVFKCLHRSLWFSIPAGTLYGSAYLPKVQCVHAATACVAGADLPAACCQLKAAQSVHQRENRGHAAVGTPTCGRSRRPQHPPTSTSCKSRCCTNSMGSPTTQPQPSTKSKATNPAPDCNDLASTSSGLDDTRRQRLINTC